MPHHPDADNPTAFNFDLDKKLYYCFTKCQSGGDVIDFVMNYLQVDFLEAVRYLRDHLGISGASTPGEVKVTPEMRSKLLTRREPTLREPIRQPEYPHLDLYKAAPEWVRQEVGEWMADVFDLRYTPHGFYKYRVLWPVHDHEGRPVGMTGRTLMPISDENPKWLHTPSMEKSQILFNYHRAIEHRNNGRNTPLFVVEGAKDVAGMWRMGYKTTVGLLGATMSPEQGWLVNQFSDHVILCLDNDKAGVRAAIEIGKFMSKASKGLRIDVVPLPKGKDPADLDKETFESCLRKMVSVERLVRVIE